MRKESPFLASVARVKRVPTNGGHPEFKPYDRLVHEKWAELTQLLDKASETDIAISLRSKQSRGYVHAFRANVTSGWAKPGLKGMMRVADALGYDTRIRFVKR